MSDDQPMKELLQKLLERQEKISSELRSSLEKQRELERNADAGKANLFTLTCKVSEVFSTQVEVIDAVDFNSKDILDIREEVRDNKDAITQNSKQNSEILKMIHKVNERLDKLERKQLELSAEVRAKGIVINGLLEEPNEIPLEQAITFLQNIDVSLKKEEIDIAYRVGMPDTKSEDQTPQSLIAVFYGH